MGDGRDVERPFGLAGSQDGELPLGRHRFGHQRQRHGGMAGERRRQALAEDAGVERLAEANPSVTSPAAGIGSQA